MLRFASWKVVKISTSLSFLPLSSSGSSLTSWRMPWGRRHMLWEGYSWGQVDGSAQEIHGVCQCVWDFSDCALLKANMESIHSRTSKLQAYISELRAQNFDV